MRKIDLKGNPFFLKNEDVDWVEETKKTMTTEEKIGQLFFTLGMSSKEKDLDELLNTLHPGGMMFRPSPAKAVAAAHKLLQTKSKIPMLLV